MNKQIVGWLLLAEAVWKPTIGSATRANLAALIRLNGYLAAFLDRLRLRPVR